MIRTRSHGAHHVLKVLRPVLLQRFTEQLTEIDQYLSGGLRAQYLKQKEMLKRCQDHVEEMVNTLERVDTTLAKELSSKHETLMAFQTGGFEDVVKIAETAVHL